jgi:hypothetical protein
MRTNLFSIFVCVMVSLKIFSQDTIQVVLSPASPGYKIPDDFAGLSYEKNTLNKAIFGLKKDTLIRLFQTLGIKSVRIGGNSVDKDTFSTNATSTHFTKSELDSFYLFVGKTGSKVLMGINFGGDFNPTLASSEVAYVLSKYTSSIRGFEVGNEPDLYHSNGFRPSTYTVADYESQYTTYYDTILAHSPSAIFTGPVAATNYASFTLPFCRSMHGKFTMLTQHYYVAAGYSYPTHQQIINLLSAAHQTSLLTEVSALVACADSAGVPFRMSECNSLYNGGQWGVSDAFASSLWALDYMYALASKKCAGVNFHGALGGAYSPLLYKNHLYTAQPISYGILTFQVGSKGSFIPAAVTNNKINLNLYSVIDSVNTIYTTVVNKDTLKDALIELNAGSSLYTNASYITLSASALTDTIGVSLGGQEVSAYGTCPSFTWQSLTVSANKTKLLVPAGSAAIIRFSRSSTNGIQGQTKYSNDFVLYPNPSKDALFLQTSLLLADASLVVFDMLGNVVYTQVIKGQNTAFDITELSHGMYFLKVLKGDAILYTAKFIHE